MLSVLHHYRVSEADHPGLWEARTAGYFYAVHDASGRELIAYHWHVSERSTITVPHFHLRSSLGINPEAFAKAHLPTGLISLQEIIGLTISELGVQPQRPDWRAVLDTARGSMDQA